MVRKMLGVADIAVMFDVEPKTVSMWRQRYRDFPEPDVGIGDVAGWDPDRAGEIRAWANRRPGRGRRAAPAEHVQEILRRIFVYEFMRPDDFAWAPCYFMVTTDIVQPWVKGWVPNIRGFNRTRWLSVQGRP